MAKGRVGEIELSVGPYFVTKETAEEMARKIYFRHFKPEELELAREFIRRAILEGYFYFDVYLTTAAAEKLLEEVPEIKIPLAVPWMLRIDAVCWTTGVVWLIEFKERIRTSGIGQLISYKDLFEKQYKPQRPINLMYVAKYDAPELHPLMDKLGIVRTII